MRRKADDRRRGWPTPEQELVLRSALGDHDEAQSAWTRLQEVVEMEDVDLASRLLFPLVFRNLSRHGIDGPWMDGLKLDYRWSWVRNSRLMQSGSVALAQLEDGGVETLLLKGAALAHLDYDDVGARPMADLDVLVRPAAADHAVAILTANGWRLRSSRSRARLAVVYADELRHPDGSHLDLHWRAVMSREPEDELWRASVPLDFGQVRTGALSPGDRLLHVCSHGLTPNHPPAIRWVADATTIMRRHDVDWDRLVEQARCREVSLSVGRALEYLAGLIRVPIPWSVVAQLVGGPHSRVEVAAHYAGLAPVRLGEVLRWHWWRYRRVEASRLRATIGFPLYLRMLLGYDDRRSFVRHVARRLAR